MGRKHIKTLRGLTIEQVKDFSKNDIVHYFRVKLYDRDQECKGCGAAFAVWRDRQYKAQIVELEKEAEASLDHIVPRSFGGRTRESNVQLMHRRCNCKKSNRMPAYVSSSAFVPMQKNTARG